MRTIIDEENKPLDSKVIFDFSLSPDITIYYSKRLRLSIVSIGKATTLVVIKSENYMRN